MADLTGKRIAILATHGFEHSELTGPRERLAAMGAEVHVVSPAEEAEIRGWKGSDWAGSVPVDKPMSDIAAGDYDALVLPGGQINPDLLRIDANAVRLVKGFHHAGKTVAAICHAPWLLIEAEMIAGREATSWPSLRKDLENAGATWVDEPVACEDGIVTSRNPDDVPAFCDKIAEEILEGAHRRAA